MVDAITTRGEQIHYVATGGSHIVGLALWILLDPLQTWISRINAGLVLKRLKIKVHGHNYQSFWS